MTLHAHLNVGSRCTAANRAFFWWPGDLPTPGALELVWENGSTLVFDVESDWRLSIATGPWRDPYAGVNTDDPSWDLGKWIKEPVGKGDPGHVAIGSRLLRFMPHFSEVGEMTALDLTFESGALFLDIDGGDLVIRENVRGIDA